MQKETESKIAKSNAQAETARLESAKANARAAEANLALEKFKAPRSIDQHGPQLIISKLSNFSEQEYKITTFWDLKEAFEFSNQLNHALQKAGWKYVPHGEGGAFLLGGISGIQVWTHPNADQHVRDAADALVSTLKELEKNPTLKIQNATTPNDNIIRLNIGTKR